MSIIITKELNSCCCCILQRLCLVASKVMSTAYIIIIKGRRVLRSGLLVQLKIYPMNIILRRKEVGYVGSGKEVGSRVCRRKQVTLERTPRRDHRHNVWLRDPGAPHPLRMIARLELWLLLSKSSKHAWQIACVQHAIAPS